MSSDYCDLSSLTRSIKSLCSINVPLPPSRIKTGVSVLCLQNFLNNEKNIELQELYKLVNDLVLTSDFNKRADILFYIYNEVSKSLPVKSLSEVPFFVKFIALLTLLELPRPESPLHLLKKLLYTIPKELRDDNLIEKIARDIFSTNNDIGNLTHLCMQCAHLGNDWNLLTIMMSWLSLTYILNASERSVIKPSLAQLNELLKSCKIPDNAQHIIKALHLISLLVNHLIIKESDESAKKSLDSIHEWLTVLPLHLNDLLNDDGDLLSNVKLLTVKECITNLLVNWPELNENNYF